jgi:hypothetical protein
MVSNVIRLLSWGKLRHKNAIINWFFQAIGVSLLLLF